MKEFKKQLQIGIVKQWIDKGMTREEAVKLFNEILKT